MNRPSFVAAMTSITVNVVSESESETVVPCPNIGVSILPISLFFFCWKGIVYTDIKRNTKKLFQKYEFCY